LPVCALDSWLAAWAIQRTVGWTAWGRCNRGWRTPFDSQFVVCASLLRKASWHFIHHHSEHADICQLLNHFTNTHGIWHGCYAAKGHSPPRIVHLTVIHPSCAACEINYLHLSFPTRGNNDMAAALTFNAGETAATAYVGSLNCEW
jgi:hypothetical protein